MRKTAVDFFKEELEKQLDFKAVEKFWGGLYDEAKEMEKQQIIDTCISTTQDCYRAVMEEFNQPIVFTNEDLQNQKNEAEQYYNETFKSE